MLAISFLEIEMQTTTIGTTPMQSPDADTVAKFGEFSITGPRTVDGELRVEGANTSLFLRADQEITTPSIPAKCITGTLYDLTRVTLVDCVLSEVGSGARGAERYHFARIFPHFVLTGHKHVDPDDSSITEITLVLDDASALFYDFDAFGTVIHADRHIEQLISANQLGRPVAVGPWPQINYFTGKRDIIGVETVIGMVSARHNPSGTLAGPRGVRIDNAISVSIGTDAGMTFKDAISRSRRLLRFLELIIGRPQNLREAVVNVGGDRVEERVRVHWSLGPSRRPDPVVNREVPHPGDLPLDPIRRSEEFSAVMSWWLEKDLERQDARQRFEISFANQRHYSVERLVGAANMFDILPDSAVPRDVELTEDVRGAKNSSRETFGALPVSYERDSILGALGRLGKPSLKHRTRHRALYVLETVADHFPDLVSVLDDAIDCRNYYVHGGPPKFDYSGDFDVVVFFIDSLEFVFAASELVEAGWDIRAFINTPTSMTHPFGAYRVNYVQRLNALKGLRAAVKSDPNT